MVSDVLYSSKNAEWITPDSLFNEINERYCITLDPASNEYNHKVDNYFTAKEDGLKQSWKGETVFLNPPYGRGIIDKWVKKIYEESLLDEKFKILLIPARTDTKYFQYCLKSAEMFFIKGRLRFENPAVSQDGKQYPAPFPSVIVVFNGRFDGNRDIYWTDTEFKEMWI